MNRMPRPTWVSAVLVGVGLGAALLFGGGVAQADSAGAGSASSGSGPSAKSVGHHVRSPAPTVRARLTSTARPAPRPAPSRPPAPAFVTAVTTFFGDFHDAVTGAPETRPSPSDDAATPYGRIGKWMLGPSGRPADWPSQQYPFKTLYQPINVIVVDTSSTTAEESAAKLNAALAAAGFPAQPVHSTGYRALVDAVSYRQQPTGPDQAFANAHWLLTNDHGRLFGPAPVDGAGFVWTASFSRERTGLFYVIPTHVYVSFNRARDTLRAALLDSGATDLGLVDLDNDLDGRTLTTGDHDGYAVVIGLS